MIQNKTIQIDDIQTKMSSTGNTKYILLSGKDKYYFWKIHKGSASPVYESYEGMEKAGLIRKGAIVAIGYTEEDESFVNKEGKTVNFKSRCIVGLREAGEGATVSEPSKPQSKPISQNIAPQRESRDEFSRRLGIQGHLNALLSNPQISKGDTIWDHLVETAITIEDLLEEYLKAPKGNIKVNSSEVQQIIDDEPPLDEPPF